MRRDPKKKDLLWSLLLALLAFLLWVVYPKPPEIPTGFGGIPKRAPLAEVIDPLKKKPMVAEVTNVMTGKKSESFGGLFPLPGDTRRLPVEVITKGKEPEWFYVEVTPTAVPEPSAFSLLGLAGTLLAFRRKRRDMDDAGSWRAESTR